MTAPSELQVRVDGDPVGQGRLSHVGRGVLVHSNAAELKPWRTKVGNAVVEALAGREPAHGHTPVELSLFFDVPRGTTVRRPLPAVRPDLDHLVRAVLDGLTGVLFVDDGQVVSISTEKRYAATPDRTGVRIYARWPATDQENPPC
ncbi:RusA family crossover junction endodeoxyribonuclease [Klenkia sp. LSe6-5]|uniref:RusA family crossover junction endodeoxyribonuclease n=1 Tax=Klenkia sesuvii TaxID=3103137 RepID=A0ABU8DYZ2_9ACTN